MNRIARNYLHTTSPIRERALAAQPDFRHTVRAQAETRAAKVARARELRAAGASLFAIATDLGVTKEWLREYAGL